jgi:hypothetical protein
MRLPVRLAHRFLPLLPAALAIGTLAPTGCSSSSGATEADSGTRDAAVKDTGSKDTGLKRDAPVQMGHDAAADVHANDAAATDAGADVGPLGDAGGPSDAGTPPGRSGDATPSTTATLFAIHHLWLGDSLANPTFSLPDAGVSPWATFGYNIDGLITTQYSTDVCTLDKAAGATPAKQVDGVDGIDNSFGENILSTIASAIPMISETVSGSITNGSFDVLIGTVGLTASPTQTNTGLTGALLNGAPYAGAPPLNDAGFFQVTDDWPVFSDSLHGSLEAGAVESFASAYVTNGVWVNGSPGDLTLKLLLQGQPLVLQIHQAVVTFTHTVDGAGQDHATNGTISGVLKTTELLAEINIVAAQQDYCAAATILLDSMAAASDILSDGTNVKGTACDGISIGIAFDADGIALPTVVTPSVDAGPPPMGCVADAG